MNRPEPIELENNLGPDAVTGEINRVPWMAYDVDEMDLYIAEKDAEIAELKAKLEDAKASHYAEMEDAGMRERRLRRALWLARAERANEKQQLFHFSLAYNKLCIDGFYNPSSGRRELSPKQWIKVFNKVENKCRNKAEEYK